MFVHRIDVPRPILEGFWLPVVSLFLGRRKSYLRGRLLTVSHAIFYHNYHFSPLICNHFQVDTYGQPSYFNNVATFKIFPQLSELKAIFSPDRPQDQRMADYDESNYPGPAEQDSDGEASSGELKQTSLSIDSAGPPPDFTCSVCSDILLDPVSLHCGHTFCQLCLAGVWQSSGRLPAARLACPVCRLPWRNFPGVNITLRYVSTHSLSLIISHK